MQYFGDAVSKATGKKLWTDPTYRFRENGGRMFREGNALVHERPFRLEDFAWDDAFRPRAASATNETGACFADVSASPPPWLYDPGWNLMKATSRGPVAAAESLSVDCRYRRFCVGVW